MHNSLIYNLNIFLTFATLIVSIVYCINIFLSHTFKKWELLILSLSSSLVFIISIGIFNFVPIALLVIPFFFYLFKKNIQYLVIKFTFLVLYLIILAQSSKIILSLFLAAIKKIEYNYSIFLQNILFLFLLFLITKRINIILNSVVKNIIPSEKYKYILYFCALCTLTTYYIFLMYSIFKGSSYIRLLSVITGIIFILLCTYITVSVLKNIKLETNNKIESAKLEQQKKYILALEKNNNEIRKFKHDFNNIILGLDGYINNDDFNKEKLKKYFNSTIMTFNNNIELNDIVIAKLNSIKVSSLKSLITNKVLVAQNNNIDVDINIQGEIHDFYTDEMQLSRVLGVLLDNAIEASLEVTDDKKIDINIIQIDKTTDIQISNTFNNTGTPLEDFNKEGFSTKGTNRGLGLSSAHEITNKLNMLLNTEIDGNTFIQNLSIEGNY
ncbi:hypothetical protein CJ217_03050 [Streptococcus sp. UMB1385]|nr:hypothetical protein CJ217_03050 [Streptococcus sp. UMB1385]